MKKTKAQHRHAKQAKKRERQAKEHSREKFGCAGEVDPWEYQEWDSWHEAIPEDHWEYEEEIYSKDDRLLVAITVCLCIVAWVLCAFMGSR